MYIKHLSDAHTVEHSKIHIFSSFFEQEYLICYSMKIFEI